MNKEELKQLLREILQEEQSKVRLCKLPQISCTEADRLDTGDAAHRVYTHDLFSLQESPRLGCGIMEMTKTTFPWTLEYDEIDYVISGSLTIEDGANRITAGPGELILIPKGSQIRFSVPEHARFLYVTYRADWQNQTPGR